VFILYVRKHALVYSNLFSSANALHMNLVYYQKFLEGNDIVVLDHSKFILCVSKKLRFLKHQT